MTTSHRVRHSASQQRAFSLLAMIGVLAVIAILATVLVPPFIRQMDKIAGDQESAALKAFGDALQQSIMRKRYIPSATDWATNIAAELGVDVAYVTTGPRRQPRLFLIDPRLSINNTGVTQPGNGTPALPYSQVSAGSGNLPSSKVLILSGIGRALPAGLVSGVPTAADFTNIWNAADGTVPTAAPVFASWPGSGEDLKVHRIDLAQLFVPLQLSFYAPRSTPYPRYAIDPINPTNGATATTVSTNIKSYFIQNSILALYTHQTNLDSQQILIRDNSFVYDQNVWRGTGGFLIAGVDIAKVVDEYLAAFPNARAQNGANQQAIVVQSMMDYMARYSDWAAAGFPYSNPNPPQSYQNLVAAQAAMKNAVQDQYMANSHDPTEVLCQ